MPRPIRQHNQINHPENLERWMVSYADFITLLFAFFVVMYAISSVNEGKYRVFGASLSQAFGTQGQSTSASLVAMSEKDKLLKSLVDRRNSKLAEKIQKQKEYMQQITVNLNQVMAPLVTSGQVAISQSDRGIVLDINASALFKQGDADLQNAAVQTLSEVAKILGPNDQAIEVEGHTDDVPIKNPRFPSNWELSSARASSVARLFIDHGIQSRRLTVMGAAENQPIASNDTPEGRARNRRITVTLLSPALERPAQQPGR